MAMYFRRPCVSLRYCFYLSGCDEMSEAVRVRETGTRPAESQNRKGKRSQTVYAPMLRVFSFVLLTGIAKNKRVSNRKCRVYIVSISGDRH